MNISSSYYTHNYQGYALRAFTSESVRSFLSLPPLGSMISTFLFKKITPVYTRMLFEFSELPNFIDELDNTTINKLLIMFQRHLKMTEVLNTQKSFFEKSPEGIEFAQIIGRLNEKVNENIDLLEEKLHPNHSYSVSVNYPENDWNAPENDHWDNY
jgi:hypothetical protein